MEETSKENAVPVPKPYEWLTEEHKRSLVRFFQLLEIAERRVQERAGPAFTPADTDSDGA